MSIEINKKQKEFAELFALFINAILLVDLFRMLTNNNVVVSIIQYGIYMTCAIYVYWQIVFSDNLKIDKALFAISFILILITIISYVICPKVIVAYGYFISFGLTRIIPALYFVLYIDKNKLSLTFEYLKKNRLLWALYAIVGMVWIPLHTNNWNQYSMTYGYNLVIPACIAFYCFFKHMKIKWLFYGMTFFIFMLLRGSRASVLCLLIFILLAYVMINRENVNTRKSKKIFVLLVVALIVLINFNHIALLLSKTFPSSRTLALLSSNINFDSGRSDIQSLYWNAIKAHPFTFNGIFTDRVYYSNVTKHAFDMTNYPHELTVELFYQYGIPFGAVILTIIIVGIIKSIRVCDKYNNSEFTCLFLVLFVTGFIKLFFSASYLVTVEFYMLLGIMIKICRKNKTLD